jgi:metal-sulfur cluster biosynthetic enzyme
MAEAVTEEQVVELLKTCYDPEIPLNLYDLGLIYGIEIDEDKVFITMSLTAAGCPMAGTVGPEVENRLLEIEGINDSQVDIVWDPPWTPEMLRPEAKELLSGLM